MHELVLRLLRLLARPRRPITGRSASIAGLQLANPVGLAAGFVKDARYIRIAAALGFGFVEIGTVTRLPQRGNPRPRLFRLLRDRALINRFGFNNPGLHATVEALAAYRRTGMLVAANLGKGKRTHASSLARELAEGVELLTPYADFFVVNVSSPNTPGLRALLEPELLDGVLHVLRRVRAQAADFWGVPCRPLLLKLHPDLKQAAWQDMLAWLPRAAIDGVVATNTTTERDGLQTPRYQVEAIGAGGVSGAPLAAHRRRMVAQLRAALPPPAVVLAVGGIQSRSDVAECLAAGADAVEVYTGLIYGGPDLVRKLARV